MTYKVTIGHCHNTKMRHYLKHETLSAPKVLESVPRLLGTQEVWEYVTIQNRDNITGSLGQTAKDKLERLQKERSIKRIFRTERVINKK